MTTGPPVMTPIATNPTSGSSNSSSSGAHCSRSDSIGGGDDGLLDDDSNPQQGTPTNHKGVGPPPAKNAPPSEGGVAQSSNASTTPSTTTGANGAATTARHPSRPNSGSRDAPSSKFPATVKDIRKLFVGGLPSDVTSEEFRQFFEQYGTVLDSVVMFDRITLRSRGFGFVTFEDYAIGQQLVKLGHVPMRNNKCVEIKPAEPKGSVHPHPAPSTRYVNPPSPYHPSPVRANFGGMIPLVPSTTTTVEIMGETTTAASMDPSPASGAWVSTVPVAATPTRVSIPPPFYPSPNMMMDQNITETTVLHANRGGGMCLDLPVSAAGPFLMPYPMYPSAYEGAPYPHGMSPAPPLYSAPLYDMYAGSYASYGYDTAVPEGYDAASWVASHEAPAPEGGFDRAPS